MKKQALIICTSPNSNEFIDYWKRENAEFSCFNQLIIIQGYNNNDLIEKIKNKVDSFYNKEFDIYMLRHMVKFQKSEQKKTDKGTEYTCFYYSTTDKNLNDFWSYISGETWQIPQEKPQKPLDLLCWEINQTEIDNTKVTTAINEVVEYYKKKGGKNAKLNAALEFLHESLGGAPANINIFSKGDEKFDLDKKYEKFENKSLRDLIDELKNRTGDKYNEGLRNVRDVLLVEAGVVL